MFSTFKKEKYHPSSTPHGYKQWFRRLRTTFKPIVLKEALTAESLEGADILVLGAPGEKFSLAEFDTLKGFIHRGGSLLLMCDEGGEEAMGTNVNYLIEEYGISVNSDCMVRTVHQKYFHPKETLVTDGILNRAITTFADKKSHGVGGHRLGESADGSGLGDSQRLGGGGEAGLAFVAPYCSTLMVQKPAVAILSSGKIAYPMQRPVGALWKGVEARGEGSGRVAVLGSGRMADDEWLDKEDNAKILDFVLRWLSPGSQLRLYDLDAEEPEVSEYTHVPDVEALAERLRSCLQEGDELPKDFTALFDDTLYKLDTGLIPEAVELYGKLSVKKAALSLIAPQFETPLPPLQPAVFPPALREPPAPALDLFDLEEEFASEKSRLSKLFGKCAEGTDEDLEFFVREGARICGVAAEEGKMNGDTGKALLAQMFRQIVHFKMCDDFSGGGGGGGGGGYSPGAGNSHKSSRLDHIEDELGGIGGGGSESMLM
jgi:intraflagellar transport protein 52